MGSTDISSSRYSINRWAEQISSPGDTVLTDGQHRYIFSRRYRINRWAALTYPPSVTVLTDGQHRRLLLSADIS
jgi:surfactin synthase thioesterase subunit